ncbi:MAG: biotin--[acetyl-CoA-carboxylase] ligase, partial [Acidimicrobiales bacterium]
DAVVIGLGLNTVWSEPVPDELDGIAIALNHLTDEPVERGDLLVTLLLRLEAILADPEHSALLERWRHLATTLGRDVRVELASGAVIVGRATDLNDRGRLVVATADGPQEVTAGDVHHLRPA